MCYLLRCDNFRFEKEKQHPKYGLTNIRCVSGTYQVSISREYQVCIAHISGVYHAGAYHVIIRCVLGAYQESICYQLTMFIYVQYFPCWVAILDTSP